MHRPRWKGAICTPGAWGVWPGRWCPSRDRGAGHGQALARLPGLPGWALALPPFEGVPAFGGARGVDLAQGYEAGSPTLPKPTPAVTSVVWGGVFGWVTGGLGLAVDHGLPENCWMSELYLRMRQMRLEFRYAAVGDAGDELGLLGADVKPVMETSLVEGLASPFEEERPGWRALVEDLSAGRRENW